MIVEIFLFFFSIPVLPLHPSFLSADWQREGRETLRASPVDDPLDAGRWISSLLRTLSLHLFLTADPLFTSGLFSTLSGRPTLPLEMTEDYVLRCVLMLCCALLSANASNWL